MGQERLIQLERSRPDKFETDLTSWMDEEFGEHSLSEANRRHFDFWKSRICLESLALEQLLRMSRHRPIHFVNK